MAAEPLAPRRRAAAVLLFLLCLVLGCGSSVALAAPAPADPPGTHATYGPGSGKAPPEEWTGTQVGVDKQGNYCQLYRAQDCRPLKPSELPDTARTCVEGEPCANAEVRAVELRKLKDWRAKADHGAPDFAKLDGFLTTCVEKGDTFQSCLDRGAATYPAAARGPDDWVAGKISDAASDALQETASYIAKAVVWLLEEFANVFGVASSIDLGSKGVSNLAAIGSALSAVVATFLLLLQFGRVSMSHRGGPAATAVAGLVKWAAISSVYFLAVQTALTWSDAVSNWIVNYTFGKGGTNGDDAAEAMRAQLGRMFGGLISGRSAEGGASDALVAGDRVEAPAVGVIIVVGIVCILAIGALWVEILLRQAAILIFMATMPVILAGQMSEATRTWWPRARDTLVILILMKPLVMVCFSIGFFAMSPGRGVQNMIVGLVVFLMAIASWPVLATFVTPARISAGLGLAGGLFGSRSAGASAASSPAHLTGAGTVGGGAAYTRALEDEATAGAARGPRPESTRKPFWSHGLLEAGVRGPTDPQRLASVPNARKARNAQTDKRSQKVPDEPRARTARQSAALPVVRAERVPPPRGPHEGGPDPDQEV
jgi:hypothetical protein